VSAPSRLSVVTSAMRNGAAAPLVVMAMLAMVVVPLAPLVLDAMFTLNIALSLVVLLAVVYVKRPLEFSVFPSVLLMVTLLRLALNVASTRVVLLHGHEGAGAAGNVIESFGHFVIGGNYAVGLVVFAGEAFIQCPLTTDYAAARLFLRAVEPMSMASQGTAIADALYEARDVLQGGGRGEAA